MTKTTFNIVALSDATGNLANILAIAASRQFKDVDVNIIRRRMITTEEEIQGVIMEAKNKHAVLLFTMVSQDLRKIVLSEAKKEGIIAMDVMGPVLDMLSHYFHKLPSDEPGLQYKVARDYYQRTEALDFTVRHDDGLNIENLGQADVVLMGISRTSKTPISIYLAYQGYRCANVPIIKGVPLPEKIFELDHKKLVGITASTDRLVALRSSRMKKMGRPESEDYAQLKHVEEEINYAKEIFEKLPGMHVVDMTGKAIEEVASEIIHTLSL